jgi:hypothetical protein
VRWAIEDLLNVSSTSVLDRPRKPDSITQARIDYLFDHHIEPVRQFGAELLSRLQASGQVRTDSVALVYFFMTHGAGGPLALPELASRFGQAVDPHDTEAVHRHAVDAAKVLFDGLLLHPAD